ncbi:hypothetical protein PMZ80_001038 [Knufia obscura]|uniref:BTB domain-containing protein n=1 Tax=Knufia obscura TaxID=1635080 RepID=A0ABR0S346_9EURO|nr:hypothetical protein PMZ80_001038 [Knufia obscura]
MGVKATPLPERMAPGPVELIHGPATTFNMEELIHFLYTGNYPKTHVAHTGVKSFIPLPDTYVVAGREDLLHASMYAMGVKYGVKDLAFTAAEAFRRLGPGNGKIFESNDWPDLSAFIYNSTPVKDRHLRNIVVRQFQWALHHDRSLLDMDKLEKLLNEIPSLAFDLATIPLTKDTYKCSGCSHWQHALTLRCEHKERHKANDNECFKLGLKEQECFKCHKVAVFSKK